MNRDATVVVCSYTLSRWDDLCAAMESLRHQSLSPAEVVLVSDHDDELLRRARDTFTDVRCVPNRGPRGLSGARNTGIVMAGTPLVAFLDDDAVAETDWLHELVRPYAFPDADVLGVGGRLVPRWDTGRPPWFPPEFDWVVGCTHLGARTGAGEIRNPFGASMSFRTEVLRHIGGFDVGLGRVGRRPVGCEETEACLRARAAFPGGVFWFAPGSVAHHRVRPERATWTYFWSRCFAEGRSKAHVRRLSQSRLTVERHYASRVLPEAVGRHVLDTLATGRPAGIQRAAAVLSGLAITSAGYLTGRAAGGPARAVVEMEVSCAR